MNRLSLLTILSILGLVFQSLVVRHDISDADLLEMAKQFPQICHFKNGEGTLISSQWILTAAHVGELYANEKDLKKLKVVCNGQIYEIKKVFVHPDYKGEPEVKNDVALVKLSTVVENVKPAKLFSGNDEKGKLITLVGAGYTGTGITGPQKELWDHKTRAATNKIDDIEGNFIFFKFDSPESENATAMEGISGPGDSGGPAFVKINGENVIVGISSHQKISIEIDENGKEQGGEGRYGVVEFYSRVSDYGSWISKNMKKN